MSWSIYLVIFKAEAPIHIGYKQIGILKTTRYYITGRAIWGALTANLTRALFDHPTSGNYLTIGEVVKNQIKTTYFFPAIKGDKENLSKLTDTQIVVGAENFGVFLPQYGEDDLHFGILSKDEFEQIFISSFVSTALEATTRTAEEGSLHEFEVVNNKIFIDGKVRNVYWVGYLLVHENAKDYVKIVSYKDDAEVSRIDANVTISLTSILNSIRVGGERNYGFGRLSLHTFVRTNEHIFGRFNIDLNENIIFKNLDYAISHVEIDGVELEYGEIEPLLGLEWSKEKGAGQKISEAKVCVVPGSKIKSTNLILSEYGILKKVNEN